MAVKGRFPIPRHVATYERLQGSVVVSLGKTKGRASWQGVGHLIHPILWAQLGLSNVAGHSHNWLRSNGFQASQCKVIFLIMLGGICIRPSGLFSFDCFEAVVSIVLDAHGTWPFVCVILGQFNGALMALSSFTNIGSSLKAHWASWLVRDGFMALGRIDPDGHTFAWLFK
jgi:hypothetical protein